MADLICVTGEKGGIGKSMVSKTIAQFLLDHGVLFDAYDSDRSNPDLYRVYGKKINCKLAIFSEAERFEDAGNAVFNAALKQLTLVNLPAQSFLAVKQWIEANSLLDLAQEVGVIFWFFWVTDGGYDSLNLLQKTLHTYQDSIRYVVLLNEGKNDDWAAFYDDDELQGLLQKNNATVITFPKLIGSVCKNKMDADSLTFGEVLEHGNFGIIDRQRIKNYLKKSYETFKKIEIFQLTGEEVREC
jgi:hypothetical protein